MKLFMDTTQCTSNRDCFVQNSYNTAVVLVGVGAISAIVARRFSSHGDRPASCCSYTVSVIACASAAAIGLMFAGVFLTAIDTLKF